MAFAAINTLREVIGNTPLLVIDYVFRGRRGRGVCEGRAYEPESRVVLRTAWLLHILQRAYGDGSLQTDDVIAEATSGNSGISLAADREAPLGHIGCDLYAGLDEPGACGSDPELWGRGYLDQQEAGGFLGKYRTMPQAGERPRKCVFLPRQLRTMPMCRHML